MPAFLLKTTKRRHFRYRQWLLIGLTIAELVASVLLVLAAIKQKQMAADAPTAVTTYQSISLYWSPPGGSTTNQCNVKYRQRGTTVWQDALPLWYDTRTVGGRSPEYRGSIVMLKPGTTYEIQLTLSTGTTTTFNATTWNEIYPISKTVTVPSGGAYTITQGGTSTGYILYTGPARINGGSAQNAVTISASYVIVRGLTVTGGSANGIYLDSDAHDVIIEQNDISGWGPSCSPPNGCGELDSGIRAADDGSFTHITIQRNKIHNPNATSWTWCENDHPSGPRGIALPDGAVNNVIRYNEISGDANHTYNDGMGENNNDSTLGFPVADTDIYGNIIQDVNDDAIEADGGDRNVRIWGNFIDRTYVGISSATMSVGPLYIFRNIEGHSSKCARQEGGYNSNGEHGPFDKQGNDDVSFGEGPRYFINNTILQPGGANFGLSDYGDSPVINTTSWNNIWNVTNECYSGLGSNNTIDYDLCSSGAQGANSINGKPTYASGGYNNGPNSNFELAPDSQGIDTGKVIHNFTDSYVGVAPDMGAQETGAPKLEFGVNAYLNREREKGVAVPLSNRGLPREHARLSPELNTRCNGSRQFIGHRRASV